MMVFQIQLTRRNDALPLTRDYMEKCEKALPCTRSRMAVASARKPSAAGARSRAK